MHRYLKLATKVAELSQHKQKVGCVWIVGGSVVGLGFNKRTNDASKVPYGYCTTHAEINAGKQAGFPRKAKVYVSRVLKNGEVGLSKPCANCQEVLDGLQAKVFYTT